MVGPKALNAVAAVNAPFAGRAFVAACLPILGELRLAPASECHLDNVPILAGSAFAERFAQDDPLAMSLQAGGNPGEGRRNSAVRAGFSGNRPPRRKKSS